jgi:hypothetical protein
MNVLHGLIVTAPDELRTNLAGLHGPRLIQRCARLQPEQTRLVDLLDQPDTLVLAAAKIALSDLARRWQQLNDEIKTLDVQLAQLLPRTAPGLLALPGVGPTVAGQLLSPIRALGLRLVGEPMTQFSGAARDSTAPAPWDTRECLMLKQDLSPPAGCW